jgi:hypothetical protein
MARLGADYCLAWINACIKANCQRPQPHGSHGATDCVTRAINCGVPKIELVQTWKQVAVPDPDVV